MDAARAHWRCDVSFLVFPGNTEDEVYYDTECVCPLHGGGRGVPVGTRGAGGSLGGVLFGCAAADCGDPGARLAVGARAAAFLQAVPGDDAAGVGGRMERVSVNAFYAGVYERESADPAVFDG